jgi:hypothetical protein
MNEGKIVHDPNGVGAPFISPCGPIIARWANHRVLGQSIIA